MHQPLTASENRVQRISHSALKLCPNTLIYSPSVAALKISLGPNVLRLNFDLLPRFPKTNSINNTMGTVFQPKVVPRLHSTVIFGDRIGIPILLLQVYLTFDRYPNVTPMPHMTQIGECQSDLLYAGRHAIRCTTTK